MSPQIIPLAPLPFGMREVSRDDVSRLMPIAWHIEQNLIDEAPHVAELRRSMRSFKAPA